ncbi:MAG: 2-amino-4-hydroxy-6-hydroxymethyldihydropteridine diphosphokinase [Lachnospiraceae bacterium]|nr:2-amino-4-hydroxy-6-hydroxymethyldihydropteridine diphosphokinase [Lachnospiraceae bacterium]
MDEIRIENLEVYAGHGVYEEENRKGQTFFVNVIMYTDVKEAGSRDELSLSTNYGEVCHKIHTCLRENTFQLIEAVAEFTAEQILLAFPLIQALSLEIRKPDAPVGLPFESVSVKICRGWKKAYLAVGSNMGEKAAYIKEAVEKLVQNPKIRKVCMSELLVTKPYGGVEQDDFLNGAIELETLYTPMELLEFLQQTEAEAGRERLVHWGPRTLDLDILFYEDVVSDVPRLMIPHPDMQNREFVLKPLAELCPYYRHPLTGKAVMQMLKELTEKNENFDLGV